MIIIFISDDLGVCLLQSDTDFGTESKLLFLLRTHGIEESRCMDLESRFESESLLYHLEDVCAGQVTELQILRP